jgi:MoxR-like ATPase
MATALGLSFSRIQFTPDLLPADITGSTIYNEQTGEFEFNKGPLFANIVLADELNRASPKTQAALLEAMEEGQITIEGESHPLPDPFFVIATQNPIDQEGTFPLPAAQKDRFIAALELGYPDFDDEVGILSQRLDRDMPTPEVSEVLSAMDVSNLQTATEDVDVDRDLLEYIVSFCRTTREDDRAEIGVSPRGSQRLLELVRGLALVRGREYVVPDDITSAAVPALSHRIVLTSEATVQGISQADIVKDAVSGLDVPGSAENVD